MEWDWQRAAVFLEQLDETRRRAGALLDYLGFGPRITQPRSSRMLAGVTLRAYQAGDSRSPAILIVPAPVKKFYIWDLQPESSPVRKLLEAGFQVYLLDWAGSPRGPAVAGLGHYAHSAILNCVEAIKTETRQERIFLIGHSLGGTLGAIFSSLHPQSVRGLVQLEAPISFGAGTFSLAASLPTVEKVAALKKYPGTLIDLMSTCADPYTYQIEPWIDRLQSNVFPAATALHWRVRRWALDETPIPSQLVADIVKNLYRENRFERRTLGLGGKLADPRSIEAPILCVSDRRSRIVPWSTMEAYRRCTRTSDIRVIAYPGDVGVVMQHLGTLVGPHAHTVVWPEIEAWLKVVREKNH
jgi:polyhydroxyalkanoate synthase